MTTLREEVARTICGFGPRRDGETWGPATRGAWDTALRKADAVIPIILGRAAEVVGSIPPRTYAYRYGDCWRVGTGGREINGSRPTEAQALVTQEFVVAAIRQIGRGE